MSQSPFPHLIKPGMIKEMAECCDEYVEYVSSKGLPQKLYDKKGKPTMVRNPFWNSHLPRMTHNNYYPSPEMHEEEAKVLEPACRKIFASLKESVGYNLVQRSENYFLTDFLTASSGVFWGTQIQFRDAGRRKGCGWGVWGDKEVPNSLQ